MQGGQLPRVKAKPVAGYVYETPDGLGTSENYQYAVAQQAIVNRQREEAAKRAFEAQNPYIDTAKRRALSSLGLTFRPDGRLPRSKNTHVKNIKIQKDMRLQGRVYEKTTLTLEGPDGKTRTVELLTDPTFAQESQIKTDAKTGFVPLSQYQQSQAPQLPGTAITGKDGKRYKLLQVGRNKPLAQQQMVQVEVDAAGRLKLDQPLTQETYDLIQDSFKELSQEAKEKLAKQIRAGEATKLAAFNHAQQSNPLAGTGVVDPVRLANNTLSPNPMQDVLEGTRQGVSLLGYQIDSLTAPDAASYQQRYAQIQQRIQPKRQNIFSAAGALAGNILTGIPAGALQMLGGAEKSDAAEYLTQQLAGRPFETLRPEAQNELLKKARQFAQIRQGIGGVNTALTVAMGPLGGVVSQAFKNSVSRQVGTWAVGTIGNGISGAAEAMGTPSQDNTPAFERIREALAAGANAAILGGMMDAAPGLNGAQRPRSSTLDASPLPGTLPKFPSSTRRPERLFPLQSSAAWLAGRLREAKKNTPAVLQGPEAGGFSFWGRKLRGKGPTNPAEPTPAPTRGQNPETAPKRYTLDALLHSPEHQDISASVLAARALEDAGLEAFTQLVHEYGLSLPQIMMAMKNKNTTALLALKSILDETKMTQFYKEALQKLPPQNKEGMMDPVNRVLQQVMQAPSVIQELDNLAQTARNASDDLKPLENPAALSKIAREYPGFVDFLEGNNVPFDGYIAEVRQNPDNPLIEIIQKYNPSVRNENDAVLNYIYRHELGDNGLPKIPANITLPPNSSPLQWEYANQVHNTQGAAFVARYQTEPKWSEENIPPAVAKKITEEFSATFMSNILEMLDISPVVFIQAAKQHPKLSSIEVMRRIKPELPQDAKGIAQLLTQGKSETPEFVPKIAGVIAQFEKDWRTKLVDAFTSKMARAQRSAPPNRAHSNTPMGLREQIAADNTSFSNDYEKQMYMDILETLDELNRDKAHVILREANEFIIKGTKRTILISWPHSGKVSIRIQDTNDQPTARGVTLVREFAPVPGLEEYTAILPRVPLSLTIFHLTDKLFKTVSSQVTTKSNTNMAKTHLFLFNFIDDSIPEPRSVDELGDIIKLTSGNQTLTVRNAENPVIVKLETHRQWPGFGPNNPMNAQSRKNTQTNFHTNDKVILVNKLYQQLLGQVYTHQSGAKIIVSPRFQKDFDFSSSPPIPFKHKPMLIHTRHNALPLLTSLPKDKLSEQEATYLINVALPQALAHLSQQGIITEFSPDMLPQPKLTKFTDPEAPNLMTASMPRPHIVLPLLKHLKFKLEQFKLRAPVDNPKKSLKDFTGYMDIMYPRQP